MATTEHVTVAPRCNREVGTQEDWRQCDRPAVVFADRTIGSMNCEYRVYYCRRHEQHAKNTEKQVRNVRTVRTGAIVVER